MLDALPLPPRPNLEQYEKQAKELLKACKSADPQALPAWVTQWVEAQLRIDPAVASARRDYPPGEIAHRIRHGIGRVKERLGVTDTARKAPEAFFNDAGQLKPPATQAQMNYGFAWACEFGRTEVAAILLDNGMDPDARLTQRGETGLHWAAYGAYADIVQLLLERVTRVDVKDQSHQSTPLEWAVFAWNNSDNSNRFDYYKVVAMLVRAGAVPDPKWFEAVPNRQSAAQRIASDPQMLAALKGQVLPA